MPPIPASARKNIEAIALVEQQLHGKRSRAEKVGDAVARFFGSLWFIAAHAAFFAAWIGWNVGLVPGAAAFDPYPFPFLDFGIGVEFIFLTTFVLMNQATQARRQEHWGHITLQVALLTEQEVTNTLQTLQRVCEHLGLESAAGGGVASELALDTPVEALVEEIARAREAGEAEGDGPAGP